MKSPVGFTFRTIVAACLFWVAGVVACNRACPVCDAAPVASTVATEPAISDEQSIAQAWTVIRAHRVIQNREAVEMQAELKAIDDDQEKWNRDRCDDYRLMIGKGGALAGQPIDPFMQKRCAKYWK